MRRRRPEPPLPRGVTLDPTFEVVPVTKAPTEPATPRTSRPTPPCASDCACGCHR